MQTLEESPHRLIIGHTRGGKTTLIHHMATAWAARGERVLVGDPDAAPGLWPGCEVRGAGDDVAAIEELLTLVAAEVSTRRAARAQGQRSFPPLHLVIDEAQDVVPVLPGALALVEDVARRGGKLGVRLTLGVQDKQVGTLGLDGKSHLLRNFQTADVLKDRTGQRVAVLRDAVTGERVTYAIPPLTDPESLIRRATAPVPAEQDALLATLLASAIPPHQDAGECPVPTLPGNGRHAGNGHSSVTVEGESGTPVTVNVTQVTASGRSARGADHSAYSQALIALYHAAGAEGRPFSPLYAQLKGSKEIVFAAWQAGKKEPHHA
ncbi:MAG: type IV secretory system conjugative DNA transfer family protein [Comamonadaceae bacterium]